MDAEVLKSSGRAGGGIEVDIALRVAGCSRVSSDYTLSRPAVWSSISGWRSMQSAMSDLTNVVFEILRERASSNIPSLMLQ